MINARKRCTICSQIWKAVTSDKARESRHALIFAKAVALVFGIHAPFAVGKSRIGKITMLMAHRGPERKLNINRNSNCNGERFDWRKFLRIDNCSVGRMPEFGSSRAR